MNIFAALLPFIREAKIEMRALWCRNINGFTTRSQTSGSAIGECNRQLYHIFNVALHTAKKTFPFPRWQRLLSRAHSETQ